MNDRAQGVRSGKLDRALVSPFAGYVGGLSDLVKRVFMSLATNRTIEGPGATLEVSDSWARGDSKGLRPFSGTDL